MRGVQEPKSEEADPKAMPDYLRKKVLYFQTVRLVITLLTLFAVGNLVFSYLGGNYLFISPIVAALTWWIITKRNYPEIKRDIEAWKKTGDEF